ncbi:MAG: NUDIX hydrolase [Chloroflexi bacterium]|nr:NUDIX hydrolase [Chloroflexota bacterium]
MIAKPRDAATLILMRDADRGRSGFEILMVRRHAKSAFMPGAFVFPGGRIEASDYTRDAEKICHGLGFSQAQDIIADTHPPEKALAFFVAAIRETFEEAGILLAYREVPDFVALDEEEKTRFAEYRKEMKKDPFSFTRIMEREGLKLATEKLFYFAHWITPEISPIRFDARFFVAAVPAKQEALEDAFETTAHMWISPQKVLQEHKRGLPVPYATLSNITVLAQFSSVAEVIASTKNKEIPAILPSLTLEEAQNELML